jgi:hypothetical protein
MNGGAENVPGATGGKEDEGDGGKAGEAEHFGYVLSLLTCLRIVNCTDRLLEMSSTFF